MSGFRRHGLRCGLLAGSALLLALSLLGCDGTVTNCACTISIGEVSRQLLCGDEACIAGSLFGCDEDNVVSLGLCVAPDLGPGDGGACLPLQASCDPGGASSCCGPDADAGIAADAGAVAPSCDPVSRHCCVPTGSTCTGSADCCDGRACVTGPDGLRCGA